MKCVLLCALILVSCINAQGPNLYTVVTEYGGDYTETIVWTGKISLENGTITKLVENFIYVGGSATYDGISDFDDANEIYYFANDFATSFIYASDTKRQLLLPTIDTGAKEVMRIHHDDVNQRLLSVQLQNTGTAYVVQVPTSSNSGKAKVVTALPNTVSYNAILTSTFDATSQMFYLLSANTSNPNGAYYISQSNLDAAVPTFASAPLSSACPSGITSRTFPQFIAYDPVKQQIIAGAEEFVNNQLVYYIYIMLPNGQCSSKKIPLQEFGIATCWAYDYNARTMYFALAPNGTPQVYSVNVDSMTLSKPIDVDFTPSSIEVSYK